MFGIITATIGTSIAGWFVTDFQIIDPIPQLFNDPLVADALIAWDDR